MMHGEVWRGAWRPVRAAVTVTIENGELCSIRLAAPPARSLVAEARMCLMEVLGLPCGIISFFLTLIPEYENECSLGPG